MGFNPAMKPSNFYIPYAWKFLRYEIFTVETKSGFSPFYFHGNKEIHTFIFMDYVADYSKFLRFKYCIKDLFLALSASNHQSALLVQVNLLIIIPPFLRYRIHNITHARNGHQYMVRCHYLSVVLQRRSLSQIQVPSNHFFIWWIPYILTDMVAMNATNDDEIFSRTLFSGLLY